MSAVLVVTAHPDDEILVAGSTLACLAADGVDTGVVCLTRGELGPIADPTVATRETLAGVRLEELRKACAELGVGFVRCYRRPDGSLRFAQHSQIARQLAGLFERRNARAVITFGADGLYYHPDHVAVSALVRRAAARLEHPPTVYRSVWPKATMVALGSELRRRGLPEDLWGLEPEDFGVDDLDGAFALDVRRFSRRKLRALHAHRSQIGPGHAFASLNSELMELYLGFEWFAVVSGPEPDWLRERVGGRG